MCQAGLAALRRTLAVERASVLTFDDAGVARFCAWAGISEAYRSAVEGHCPWVPGEKGARPILVPDTREEATLAAYLPLLEREGIRALAFIPLPGSGGVLGKFALYYNEPHSFTELEVQLASMTASQAAHATERVRAAAENRRQAERVAEQAALLNLAQDGILSLSMEGCLEFWNTGAERMYGWQAAEVIGLNCHQLLATITPEPLAEMKAKLVQHGIWEGELRHKTRAGEYLIVSSRWALRTDAERRPVGILEITRDITEQKRSEQALAESEERLSLAIASTQIGTFDVYPQERRLIWSSLAKRHFGLLSGEAVNSRAVLRAVHREDRDAVLAHVRKVLSGEEDEFSFEYRATGIEDGKERWLRTWGRVFRGRHGAASRVIGVLLDVTSRKAAEKGVEDVLSSIRESFIAIDREWRFTFVNERAANSLGLPRDRIVGRNLWDLWPEYRESAFYTNYRRVLEERVPARFEVYSPDRTRCWEVHAYPTDEGLSAYVLDVTSRVAAEHAVRESEKRYRSLVEALTAVVWSADEHGQFGDVEGGWQRYTGQSPEEQQGNGWLSAFHPDERTAVEAAWRGAVASAAHWMHEARLWHTATRGYRHVSLAAVPVMEDDQRIREWVGTVTDVHEQTQLEEKLRQSAKLESLGVLAGGIAHDFNNLLTGILGGASLLQDELSPGSPLQFAAETIVQASERAAALTRQMLAYSGRGRFIIEPLDLSRQAAEIVKLLNASISKEVQLVLTLDPALPAIQADAGQLQQLVMNLVINAAEAIQGHGIVWVRTGTRRLPSPIAVHSGDLRPGEYVFLEVKDTGTGMDGDTLAKIFDPFFTTKFTGRGLGLAAALGIVRGHNGGISVESVPGGGATFTVFLPPVGGPLTEAAQPAAARRAKGTVLVIDDEEIVVKTARTALERRGYHVVSALNGRAGVDLFAAAPDEVDLVLLDMTMPVLGGEEAFRLLRGLRPDVRVLGSSGYSEQEALRRFGAGLAGFVQKPYTAQELCRSVAAAFGRD